MRQEGLSGHSIRAAPFLRGLSLFSLYSLMSQCTEMRGGGPSYGYAAAQWYCMQPLPVAVDLHADVVPLGSGGWVHLQLRPAALQRPPMPDFSRPRVSLESAPAACPCSPARSLLLIGAPHERSLDVALTRRCKHVVVVETRKPWGWRAWRNTWFGRSPPWPMYGRCAMRVAPNDSPCSHKDDLDRLLERTRHAVKQEGRSVPTAARFLSSYTPGLRT